MPGEFQPGDYVETPLGKARVVRLTPTGLQVSLEKYGLEVHVSRQKVTLIKRSIASGDTSVRRAESPSVDEDAADQPNAETAGEMARGRTLEALRFGLVPSSSLPSLTLGYDDLHRWVLDVLPEKDVPKPVVAEIVGAFGTGKSHTMAAIRHVAREAGYLTCFAEVDATRVSLCNPEALLFALWSTLAGRDLASPTPLLDVYVRAVESGMPTPHVAPKGIDRVHDNYEMARLLLRHGAIDKYGYVLDSILCSSPEYTASEANTLISRDPAIHPFDVNVRRMIGRTVLERPYDFVESIAGNAIVASLADYRGLVVTIDEFEVERFLSPTMWTRVTQLVETLGEYLNGRLDHPPAPLAMFFASAPQNDAVGDGLIDRLVDRSHGHLYKLEPWTADRCATLAARIHEMYRAHYGINGTMVRAGIGAVLEDADLGTYGDGQIRTFIKRVMARLDFHYGPPGNHE